MKILVRNFSGLSERVLIEHKKGDYEVKVYQYDPLNFSPKNATSYSVKFKMFYKALDFVNFRDSMKGKIGYERE